MQTRVEKIRRTEDPDSFFDEDNTHKAKAMRELEEKLQESEADLERISSEIG
jgi:hypothetical protein